MQFVKCVWAAAVVVAATGTMFAQQDKAPSPATSTTPAAIPAVPPKMSKPVSFSIVVQDKHHHPQTNVTKEELQLLEDSKPQSIQSLVMDTDRPLLLGLLVDTSRRQEEVLEAERKLDTAFLEEEVARPKDQAFVIHFDKEIELMQDLTSDKKLLDSAINDLRAAGDDEDAWSHSGDDEDSARHKRAGSTRLFDAVFLASDEILRKADGHKVLIVICDGVDHGSKESMSAAVESAQRTGTVVYAVYVPGEEERQQQPQQGGGRRSGGGSGGGGWPGSGGGGWPGGGGQTGGGNGGGNGGGGNRGGRRPQQQIHEDGRKVLEALTAKTGGRMIETKKKDEIAGALETIAGDVRSSFVLTYTPDPELGNGFHRIGITVPKHDDWKVQATEGLYTGH